MGEKSLLSKIGSINREPLAAGNPNFWVNLAAFWLQVVGKDELG
ncbi:hypothetical protein LOT_0322 [Lentilactobacillus otakiensis DSM 19908 = JCM 15040]|uniref:Uncharacterized protein n=1 Tax=Lentilactobacillus otakiensis DSM 19908 = JCM 15040 TaxID=1423780 RepID=S4NAU0_9LACO|nr:hypothetical protein LOT_0322 [Lentilactobacillus otakiensis DSM 19908 = JCM 15040]